MDRARKLCLSEQAARSVEVKMWAIRGSSSSRIGYNPTLRLVIRVITFPIFKSITPLHNTLTPLSQPGPIATPIRTTSAAIRFCPFNRIDIILRIYRSFNDFLLLRWSVPPEPFEILVAQGTQPGRRIDPVFSRSPVVDLAI